MKNKYVPLDERIILTWLALSAITTAEEGPHCSACTFSSGVGLWGSKWSSTQFNLFTAEVGRTRPLGPPQLNK